MSGSRLRVLASCTFCGHIYRQTGKPAVWLCTLQLWQAKGNGHSIHCFPARVKIMAGEGRKIEQIAKGIKSLYDALEEIDYGAGED